MLFHPLLSHIHVSSSSTISSLFSFEHLAIVLYFPIYLTRWRINICSSMEWLVINMSEWRILHLKSVSSYGLLRVHRFLTSQQIFLSRLRHRTLLGICLISSILLYYFLVLESFCHHQLLLNNPYGMHLLILYCSFYLAYLVWSPTCIHTK